ncbi:HMG (high mobility group) box protein [Ceratobasidium sp. AG-Ba]|nr:HMG (high mobility group) box protein [Ceratobasidium sp. AG-Ba]
MAAFVWPDESPASRAYSSFDNSWGSPTAMLNTADLSHELHLPPTTPDSMVFPFDDMVTEQPPLPRTGTLDWEGEQMSAAYTNHDQLGYDDSDLDARNGTSAGTAGSFYLSHNSFSGSPSSWDVGPAFGIEHPQTPDSPAFSGDSFGLPSGLAPPFSPPMPFASSLPNERAFIVGQPRSRTSARISARRTNTHSHSFSSQLRGSSGQSPSSRPTLHMRAMSHSAAMLSRPTNLVMSPRTMRNNTLDAALAQTDAPIHFHHVIATPYSTSAPSRPPAPIATAGKFRRSSTPDEDQASAGEEDPSRKRKHSPELERTTDIAPPLRSRLHPPKQAPSTWQIFFTEYLQNYKVTNPERKLNVSQAAKDGGAAYKALTSDQKEIYKRKARLAKDEYERELAAWQKTLTPEDIRTENTYRAAQRKAGKSRRSNLKDPNAPKKPLSAYFMFLQWIRADPGRVTEVFGDETETTRQSVLAAAKWRTLSDADKKPFLAQAEREKLEYEAARKEYEERTTGISNPNVYGGYMQMNTGDASGGWHHTSAEADGLDHNFGGRRSSSSNGKLAGGAAFGALVFAPSPFDEDTFEPNDMDDVFAIHQWKTE